MQAKISLMKLTACLKKCKKELKLPKVDLKSVPFSSVFHFIGADGIGMSSIAEVLLKMGYKVQGSNEADGENLQHLSNLGAKTFIGHKSENVDGADFVVFSSAVPDDNVEMVRARELGLPIIERAVMLQAVMGLKKSIGISGTHGKTTTTSFVGTLLDMAGLKPTVIDGGIITHYSSSNLVGDGDWVVAETCEAFGNLKHFTVDIAVITNIDAEHMEFYKTFDNLKNYFREYINRVPNSGLVVMCADHPVVMELKSEFEGKKNIITYGFSKDADVWAENIHFDIDGGYFDAVYKDGSRIENLHIPMFGKHNVLNSLVALSISKFLGISEDKIRLAFSNFKGVKHRFSKVGNVNGIRIFDDYAHHPKEIETTLAMARDVVGSGRIMAIFQPHRYSRLTDLFNDFLKCFDNADFVICMPVFGAGESSENMKNHIDFYNALSKSGKKNVYQVSDFTEVVDIILSNLRDGDIIVSFGAGDIKHMIYELPKLIESKK